MSAVALSSLFRVPEVPEPAAFDAEPWAAPMADEAGVAAVPDPVFPLAPESSTLSLAPELLVVSCLLYIFSWF